MNPTETKAWGALQALTATDGQASLREAFASDPGRFERFSFEAAGMFLDASKTRISDAVDG